MASKPQLSSQWEFEESLPAPGTELQVFWAWDVLTTAAAGLGDVFHTPSVGSWQWPLYYASRCPKRSLVQWWNGTKEASCVNVGMAHCDLTWLWFPDRAGINAATDVVADMQEQLSPLGMSLPWTRVQRLLYNVPLDELQVFWACSC